MLRINRKENEEIVVECKGHKIYLTLKELDFKYKCATINIEGDEEMIVYRKELESTGFPSERRKKIHG